LNALIENFSFLLPPEKEVSFLKLNSQTPLVDDFLKAIAQGTMYFHRTTNNIMRQFFVEHLIYKFVGIYK